MNILGLLLVFLIVFGLAVKHAAFILMYGSIFDWLRNGIARQLRLAETKKPHSPVHLFWIKMHELFTCNLCLTTQMGIWLCGLPVAIFLHLRWPHPFELLAGRELLLAGEVTLFLLTVFILAMVAAAAAMVLWYATELLPRKVTAYRQQQLNLETKNRLLETQVRQLVRTAVAARLDHQKKDFSLADFQNLVAHLDSECGHIGCGWSRMECRQKEATEFVSNWAGQHIGHNSEQVLEHLNQALPIYFKNKNSYAYDESSQGLLQSIYNEYLDHRQ